MLRQCRKNFVIRSRRCRYRHLFFFHQPRVLFIAFSSFFALSCSTPRQAASNQSLPVYGEPIPPNTCRIVGTIVDVDSTLESRVPKNPCSKVPCTATVRVDSILGYGQAFPQALSKGEEISVKFVFTLGATREVFPTMTESYPGLPIGSTFSANVLGRATMTRDGANSVSFMVYGYEVR